MKTAFTSMLLLAAITMLAQTKTELPRTEFSFSLSESTLAVRPGETKQVTVTVHRSKSFSKGKARLGVSSLLPQGVAVSFEPAEGNFETSVATISADPTVIPGTYQLVLNGTINYTTKGTMLKVTVASDNVAAK